MTPPLERVLAQLQGVRRSGDQYLARCPSHDDRSPSLAVREGDGGRVLLHDHAGCTIEAIVAAIGLEVRDLFAPGADAGGRARSSQQPTPQERAAVECVRLRDARRAIATRRMLLTVRAREAGGADDATWNELAALAERETALLAEIAAAEEQT
ncbi:MAG: hypothetical protein HY271_04870 [Deltaproteobacteria bacterium]|nr:hypothetical protein [Deltaproteobacteria bacterium]